MRMVAYGNKKRTMKTQISSNIGSAAVPTEGKLFRYLQQSTGLEGEQLAEGLELFASVLTPRGRKSVPAEHIISGCYVFRNGEVRG